MEICVNCRARLKKIMGSGCWTYNTKCVLCSKSLHALSYTERLMYLKDSKPMPCDMSVLDSMALANLTRQISSPNTDDVQFILGCLRQVIKFAALTKYNSTSYWTINYTISIENYSAICIMLLKLSNISEWLDEDGNTFLHLFCVVSPTDEFREECKNHLKALKERIFFIK